MTTAKKENRLAFLSSRALRLVRVVLAVTVLLFVALQFVRPKLDKPPVVADLAAPPDVQRVLRNSCYDCHSNETNLRWYDEVVPPYWKVVEDVQQGRAHLNFSEIGKLPAARQKALLFEAANQIQLGAMPPPAYTLVHRSAVVSESDLSILEKYLHPDPEEREIFGTLPPRHGAFPTIPAEVLPAPNGLIFPNDYESWQVVSTTDRFDNATVRLVLANERALKALAENRFAPWPDGSAFAKVAWEAAADSTGVMRAGAFRQVEFMIKDSTKFASTEGWGWGRWLGENLNPYGSDAHFAEECTTCHAPLERNDFIYSLPIHEGAGASDKLNTLAILPPDLTAPRASQVIDISIDKRAATTSLAYGNEIAANHSRHPDSRSYPSGSALTFVTWAQREDPHWFGARIPGVASSAEVVTVNEAPAGQSGYVCQTRTGAKLKNETRGPCANERVSFLGSTMP